MEEIARTPKAKASIGDLPDELLEMISSAAGFWAAEGSPRVLTCRTVCRWWRDLSCALPLLSEAFGSVVWRAMDTGRADDVRRILGIWGPEKTAEFLATPAPEAIDEVRRRPLRFAVSVGHSDVVRALLDLGAVVDVPHNGCNELMIAVKCGNSDIVRQLLAAGADPTASDRVGVSTMLAATMSTLVYTTGSAGWKYSMFASWKRRDGKITDVLIEAHCHKFRNRFNRVCREEHAEVLQLLRGTEQLRGTELTPVEQMLFRTQCIEEALVARVVRTSECTRAMLPMKRTFGITLPRPLPRTRSGARAHAASAELARASARGVMAELLAILRDLPALRTPANVRIADYVRQMASLLLVMHAFEVDDATSTHVVRQIIG